MSLLLAFNQQCDSSPNAIAFIEGNREITYQQIREESKRITSLLLNNNCQRVVIAIDRGIDAVIAIYAVLNAGACYIPLDLKNPNDRLNYIINDVDCQYVLGQGVCPDWVKKSHLWLDISLTVTTTEQQSIRPSPESLAAILYTSGSTGNPKGVAISHRAIKNFSDWAAKTFSVSKNTRIASLAPFHFDLSIFDIFCSLGRGATVIFIPNKLTLAPSRLTSWLSENQISIWYTVPSILSFIALKGSLLTTPLPNLKTLLFAGEIFPTAQLTSLYRLLPAVKFYNLYGPTETNVCCYWLVDYNRLRDNTPIPIGHSACGSILTIDPDNSELKVQSLNNLSGYWQRGKLVSALTADNNYCTGDKVSLNEKGEYCYHGRLDRMLKCSGYRVEPAEIEHAILQFAEVESCAVIGLRDSTSGQRPAAAVVLKKKASLSTLIKPLKQKLPIYMFPCKFTELDFLPYLANGKVDYQNLQRQLEKI